MGVGILKGSSNVGESEAFVSWLLSERVQAVLKEGDRYYLPTRETVESHKDRQGQSSCVMECRDCERRAR